MQSKYRLIDTGKVQKRFRQAAKKLAKEVLVKLRKYLVNIIALMLFSCIVVIAINYFSAGWQSRLIVALKKVGVPEWLVPADPKGFTYTVEVGKAGFGYMTLFQRAGKNVNEIIHYDSTKLPHVLVGHRWRYTGNDATDALKAFIKQHPNCFSIKERPGGGLQVEPLDLQGDFLYGSDGRIIAFACECRPNLEQVKLQFLRDQGFLVQTEPNKANSADAKSRAAD